MGEGSHVSLSGNQWNVEAVDFLLDHYLLTILILGTQSSWALTKSYAYHIDASSCIMILKETKSHDPSA
jgi:hypothetical protein